MPVCAFSNCRCHIAVARAVASKVAGSFRGSIRAAWHISLTITRIAIASRAALAAGTKRG